jgi:hypothetical protein
MSQDYQLSDLLPFITCEDAAFEEIFSGIDFAEDALPSKHVISNVLNYSKVLNVTPSDYLPGKIEYVMN